MDMRSNIFSKFSKPNLLRRIVKKIDSFFYYYPWIILLSKNRDYKKLDWQDFKPLLPPKDRFWADPFIWEVDGVYYLFIEEYLYSTERGRISCLTLDENLNIVSNQVVLEKDYHLSYPFIFEHNKILYMIPETGENKGVEVYRCVSFPHEWVFEKNLIKNVEAYDTTLFYANGKWWLFANLAGEDGSTWDTLNLYYSDDPLSEDWIPHPLNPIIQDVSSARPGGRIFFDGNNIIRPSQNSLVRYGYSTKFNRVTTLSTEDYAEICDFEFLPSSMKGYFATHTYNFNENLTLIDAKKRRWKF